MPRTTRFLALAVAAFAASWHTSVAFHPAAEVTRTTSSSSPSSPLRTTFCIGSPVRAQLLNDGSSSHSCHVHVPTSWQPSTRRRRPRNFVVTGFPLKSSNAVEMSSASAATDSTAAIESIPEPPQQNGGDGSELSVEQKFINAVFLAATFGYALYTILNIDHGMTRGWTTGEIAMRIPLDNWGAYESYLANKPVFTKTLINVIIYLLGDWLSQTAFQGKNVLDFDIVRTLRNGFIGLCFGPLVHEYYQFSDNILPPENGLVTRLEKIVMDQTIYLTIKCSIYISAVGLLGGDDWSTVKETVKEKIGGIVITAWKFWPLVHCITYGLIPARHRILWVNSVDLVWNAILAAKAQRTSPEDEEAEEAEERQPPSALDVVAQQDEVPVVLAGSTPSKLLPKNNEKDTNSMSSSSSSKTSSSSTSSSTSSTTAVVSDKKWIADERDVIADILTPSSSNRHSTNMTAEAAVAA